MSAFSPPREARSEPSLANGELNPPSETAEQFFVRSVRCLPGVIKIVPLGSAYQGGGNYEVHVSNSEVSHKVYEIEADTYLRFPGSNVSAHALTPTGY